MYLESYHMQNPFNPYHNPERQARKIILSAKGERCMIHNEYLCQAKITVIKRQNQSTCV